MKPLNSLNGESEMFLAEPSLHNERNFSGLCHIISRVVSGTVNKLPRAYESRKQHCSSLRRSSQREKYEVASHSRAREND